jgi:hypothetical protein
VSFVPDGTQLGVAGGVIDHVAAKHCPLSGRITSASTAVLDDEYDAAVTKAMEQASVAPEVIYAFRKTGRIITEENAKFVPAAALEAWHQAIAEYEALMEDQETEPQ